MMLLELRKREKWLATFVLLGIFCMVSSCIDIINLTLEDDQEFLVVDGDFSNHAGNYQLKLYYATGQKVKARREIEGAAIQLFEEGVVMGAYEEIKAGLYQITNPTLKGETGKGYHIEIVLPNGETYQSTPEIMPELIAGDSVFFDYSLIEVPTGEGFIKRNFIEAFVATPLPASREKPYWIRWNTVRFFSFPEVICGPLGPPPNTCFVTAEPVGQEIYILDGANLAADYLPKWKIGQHLIPADDLEFRGRHYFLVNQQSITEEAHTYWRKIDRIANQSGSIFDAPPAPVLGNIKNVTNPEEIVLGYFEVSNVDSLRNFVTKSSLSDFFLFTENVCTNSSNPFSNNGRFCCDCTRLENSSLERPSWWK